MRFEKDVKYAILSVLIAVFEATLGKYLAISGAVPMLIFSFLIVCAVTESDISYVMVLSAVLGVFYDLLCGHGFGTYTVLFVISGLYTFKLRDAVFVSKWLFIVIDAFLLTIIVQVVYMIVHIGDIKTYNFWAGIWSLVLPSAVYNTAICCLFYLIYEKISKKRR